MPIQTIKWAGIVTDW